MMRTVQPGIGVRFAAKAADEQPHGSRMMLGRKPGAAAFGRPGHSCSSAVLTGQRVG
jgi:hypothetical protein